MTDYEVLTLVVQATSVFIGLVGLVLSVVKLIIIIASHEKDKSRH